MKRGLREEEGKALGLESEKELEERKGPRMKRGSSVNRSGKTVALSEMGQ